MEDGKKVLHAKGNMKQAGFAILISGKIGLKLAQIRRGLEGYFILIKEKLTKKILRFYMYMRQTVTPRACYWAERHRLVLTQ